jgi:hypothetical protein
VRALHPRIWILTAILAVLLINEAAVAGYPELNLISRHDTLHSTSAEDCHIGIADIGGGVRYWLAAKEWEQITVRFGGNTEDKTGLVQRAVVGGSIINAADKVERGIEWKLAQFCNQRVSPRWIYILCSVNGFDLRISSCPDPFYQNPETSRVTSINVLRLVVKQYLTWYNERALSFMADGSHGRLGELKGVVYQQLANDGHILCRRVSDIFDRQLDPEEDASLIIREEALRFNVGQHYPWPFSQCYLVKLALYRFGLVLHNGELSGEGRVPPFAGRTHLVQLTTEDNVLRNAHTDGGQSKKGNRPRGAGGTSRSFIGGAFMIFFGAALVAIALKLTDAPRNPIWLWAVAGGIWLIASVLVCQGLILVLTGQWFTLEVLQPHSIHL